MPRGGNQPISAFQSALQLPPGFTTRIETKSDPLKHYADEAIAWMTNSRPRGQSFWPALGLAFVAQVEHALGLLHVDHDDALLDGPRVRRTRPNGTPVRQLEFDLGESLGLVPSRSYYNAADRVIRLELRRQHPSSPGHATSGWVAYTEFVRLLGACSPSGRTRVAQWIWQQGVLPLPEVVQSGARTRQPRVFLEVVRTFDTKSGQTGGALFQAIVYAYLVAESPSLSFQSHKVNVGSSRAGAIGDVDGYLGEDIVLAAEAKDKDLKSDDEDDLEAFIEDISQFPDADAVVFARSFDITIRSHLNAVDVRMVSREEMIAAVRLWDVPKQEVAIRAMKYFLAHIQKNRDLLDRLNTFERQVISATSHTEADTSPLSEGDHTAGQGEESDS